jgi:hypothetical protein
LQHLSGDINALTRDLSELYQLGSQLNNLELEQSRTEYRLMLPRQVTSAEIPYVATNEVLGTEVKPSLLDRAYRAVERYLGRRLLQPLDGVIAAAAKKGDARVLHVGSASGVPASAINHIRGLHVSISTAGMMTGNVAKAFETSPTFDICVCDLYFGELKEFPQLVAAVQPFMAEKGAIAGFHLNQSLLELRPDQMLPAEFLARYVVRIHQVGSRTSTVMLRVMRYAPYSYFGLEHATLRRLLRFVWRVFGRVTTHMLLAPILLVHLALHPKLVVKFSGKSILLEAKVASTSGPESRTAFDSSTRRDAED